MSHATQPAYPAAAWLLGCALAACSAAPPADLPATQVPIIADADHAAALPAYLLAAGDELEVRIADAPQLDQTVKVRPDGMVTLNVVGQLSVAGRGTVDIEHDLRERYTALAGSGADRDYLIHANDELELKFPYHQQFNDQIRVRPDGKIQLQLAGTVQAEGLSPEELRHELAERYAHFLKDPDLTVIVRTATSQAVRTASGTGRGGLAGLSPLVSVRSFQTPQVFVTGEVARPGMMPYTPGMTLLQALAEAGGHLPSGDVTKLVILRRTSPTAADVLHPALTASYRRAPTRDFAMRPYDVLLIPPTRAENLAQSLDRYVYKLFAPLKNSTFGYVYGSTKVY